MSVQLDTIQKILKASSNSDAKAATKKFVPGAGKMYGVRMPVLNALAKDFKETDLDLVVELWNTGVFEERILAAKLLERIAKKDPQRSLQLVESFAKEIDSWAVCDAIGMQSLKSIVKTHQQEIFALANKLNISANMWERRLSLVLVEYYTRDRSMLPKINRLINRLENDQEYYVKKAVAWIRRNIAKEK